MLKTFYIQTEKDTNKIIDTCEIETALKLGYIEVTLETPLPPNINCGCYKYENNSIIYVPEWDKNEDREKIEKLNKEVVDLKQVNTQLQETIDQLILSSLGV